MAKISGGFSYLAAAYSYFGEVMSPGFAVEKREHVAPHFPT